MSAKQPSPQSVGDIEEFITLVRVACEDRKVFTTLEKILVLPNKQRQALLIALINNMREKGAPTEFVQAFTCLIDDQVAEKTYETIFRHQRDSFLASLLRFFRLSGR
jgi:hypothetical protein